MKNFVIAGTTAAAVALANAPAMAWEPTKPVEIVVAAGAGGASDQMARMIQAAIQKNNLMKQPMVVSLKGGASGAEALMYMKSSDGDPNRLLLAYSLIYMLPLSCMTSRLAIRFCLNWKARRPRRSRLRRPSQSSILKFSKSCHRKRSSSVSSICPT